MISLSDGVTTVELPDDLYWSDEWTWAATEQSFTRGLTGGVIIQAAARVEGRPITLQAPPRGGWMTRADLATVRAWGDTPEQELTLALRGTNYTVRFRHHDDPAIQAEPVLHFADPAPEHYVRPTLKFITVE